MVSIEIIGERVLKFLERTYLLMLELILKAVRRLRGFVERIERFDREVLYTVFSKRGIDFKDYSVFKLEISSAAFLIFTMLFVFNYLSVKKYLASSLILVSFSLYILFTSIKKDFEDYPAYKEFFLPYLALALLLALVKVEKPHLDTVFPSLHFIVLSIAGVVLISVNFRKKYSRDYTHGTVVEAGADIRVKFNYDLRSDIKPQIVLFRNTLNAREGDTVKVRVKKGFLSIRGSRPVELLGVEWT